MMAKDIKVKLTILTGNEKLNFALKRYLHFVFTREVNQIFLARLGDPATMKLEMLSSDLWIAEAFNPEDIRNPEGFRTVKKFAGKARSLLMFVSSAPKNFPREGPFWLTFPCATPLSEKMTKVLDYPPPSVDDYRYLEDIWPLLRSGPSHHHHHRRTDEREDAHN